MPISLRKRAEPSLLRTRGMKTFDLPSRDAPLPGPWYPAAMRSIARVGQRELAMKAGLLAAALPVLAGCGPRDECLDYQTKCEGTKRYICDLPSDSSKGRTWGVGDCAPGACRMLGGTATCTLAAAPDPLCVSLTPVDGGAPAASNDACEGNKLVGCYGGYRLSETDCGSLACVPGVVAGDPPSDYGGLCALSAEPDSDCVSRCPFDPVLDIVEGHICVGNVRVWCWLNYRRAEEDCGAAAICTDVSTPPYYVDAWCHAQ
jgi:hypothetical protein